MEHAMTDDMGNVGELDPSELARDREYEVRQLAAKYGLTEEQARELIAHIGNHPEKLDAAAKGLAESS
jgi:Protein of unknown function (DUF3606)